VFVCIFVAISASSYVASRRFAFRNTRVGMRTGLARYFGVTSAGLLLNSILLVALVEWAGLRPVLGTIVLALINAPANFLIHRRLTFRMGGSRTSEEAAGAEPRRPEVDGDRRDR